MIDFLTFDNRFDCIICLDGSLPDNEIFRKLAGIPIVAADAAGLKLLKIGITPLAIVGDLDSFDKDPKSQYIKNVEIVRIPEQNHNDFEKVLVYCREKGFQNLLILGFHGGELEHTLNNWSVFIRYADCTNLCLYVSGRYALKISRDFQFKPEINEIISLIPQTKAIITTKGLHWELNNEALELGIREGARNIAVSEPISISIHSGALLLFIDERLPFCPKFQNAQ